MEQPSINNTKENMEEPPKTFLFELRHRHPNSDKLYELRGQPESTESDDSFFEALEKASKENPFAELDGKPIYHDDKEVGYLKTRGGLQPKCLFAPDGSRQCGFFFKLEVRITGEDLDADTATKIARSAVEIPVSIDHAERAKEVENEEWNCTTKKNHTRLNPEVFNS